HCSSRSCPRDRDSVIRAPVMIVPDRRRALIMIALYGAILGGWFAFARWVAAAIIAGANQGPSSAVLNRLVQATVNAPPWATTVLERWSDGRTRCSFCCRSPFWP